LCCVSARMKPWNAGRSGRPRNGIARGPRVAMTHSWPLKTRHTVRLRTRAVGHSEGGVGVIMHAAVMRPGQSRAPWLPLVGIGWRSVGTPDQPWVQGQGEYCAEQPAAVNGAAVPLKHAPRGLRPASQALSPSPSPSLAQFRSPTSHLPQAPGTSQSNSRWHLCPCLSPNLCPTALANAHGT
jgi:hypothetical protein